VLVLTPTYRCPASLLLSRRESAAVFSLIRTKLRIMIGSV
jgi:hypothetical protein